MVRLLFVVAASAWILVALSLPGGWPTWVVVQETTTSLTQKYIINDNSNTHGYIFWSSDQHIAPVADLKHLLQQWRPNDTVIDESLSGHCHLKNTCSTNLAVLNAHNVKDLSSCPNELKRKFHKQYRNDQRMNTVDAFVCQHNFALCELFMSFGRPLILVASTRYELGRFSYRQWQRLNDNVRAITANSRNTVAANNRYDAEYLKHFTGLSNIPVLPNLCGYIDSFYHPTRLEVLIGPSRYSASAHENILSNINNSDGLLEAAQAANVSVALLRDLYPKFKFADLAAHPAIILIPYQVSVMSFFEYYKMGIPLFAPSLKLLVQWQLDHRILDELSWNCVRKRCHEASQINAHADSPHPLHLDPNNVTDPDSMMYWIQFADFYQFKHVVFFESWDDLFAKLQMSDLQEIHRNMMEYNKQRTKHLRHDWQKIFDRAFDGVLPRRQQSLAGTTKWTRQSWESAMRQHYPFTMEHVRLKC